MHWRADVHTPTPTQWQRREEAKLKKLGEDPNKAAAQLLVYLASKEYNQYEASNDDDVFESLVIRCHDYNKEDVFKGMDNVNMNN